MPIAELLIHNGKRQISPHAIYVKQPYSSANHKFSTKRLPLLLKFPLKRHLVKRGYRPYRPILIGHKV